MTLKVVIKCYKPLGGSVSYIADAYKNGLISMSAKMLLITNALMPVNRVADIA